eukprot:Skav212354  [mRNA]  locus=scaffold3038:39285:46781:+ [translate_table: standard]
MSNGLLSSRSSVPAPVAAPETVSMEDVKAAQKAWADAIKKISKTYLDGGDYVAAAANAAGELYGYGHGNVLFKPTKAKDVQFRPEASQAMSYFVGAKAVKQADGIAEDGGFAINGGKGWQDVLILLTRYAEGQPKIENMKDIHLPWIGHLALVRAIAATLSGKEPAIEGENPEKIQTAFATRNLVTLRVTIIWKYMDPKYHVMVRNVPESCMKLLDTQMSVKLDGWKKERETDLMTGYMDVAPEHVEQAVGKSGIEGIFICRLTRDVPTKKEVTWMIKNDSETDLEYHSRVFSEAAALKVGLAYRRGGINDLGILTPPKDDLPRPWAVWGMSPDHGPDKLHELLTGLKWKLEDRPSPAKHAKAPWRIFGVPPERKTSYAYTMTDGKNLMIIPWVSQSSKKKVEQERVCGRRWYDPQKHYDPDPIEDVKMSQVAPTALDPPTPEDPKAKAINSPDKKKQKREKEPLIPLTHGMPGPPQCKCTIADAGGQGECGWRAIGLVVAMHNTNWSNTQEELRDKITPVAQVLRAQALTKLRSKDAPWKKVWRPDPEATRISEDGEPAKTVEEFMDVLTREKRWICGYGLQAVAEAKQIIIAIFELRQSGWAKMALIVPSSCEGNLSKQKVLPLVPLALYSNHYYAILKNGPYNFPLSWSVDPPKDAKDAWMSRNFNDVSSQNSSASLRGSGVDEKFMTPMKKKNEYQVEDLIRTCSPIARTPDSLANLLRTCSPVARTSSAKKAGSGTGKKSSTKNSVIKTIKKDVSKHPVTPGSTRRLLRTCSPILRTGTPKGKDEDQDERGPRKKHANPNDSRSKLWQCPCCDWKITIGSDDPMKGWKGSDASMKISKHLQKCHNDFLREKIEQNKMDGKSSCYSGCGIRTFIEPMKFKQLNDKERKAAVFVCPYCGDGLMESPPTSFSSIKAKLHHLKNCVGNPPDGISLREYTRLAREQKKNGKVIKTVHKKRKAEPPLQFRKFNKKERLSAAFVCPYCNEGLMDAPPSEFSSIKAKLYHLKHCKGNPPGGLTLRQYYQAARKSTPKMEKERREKHAVSFRDATLDRARSLGHDPVAIPWRFRMNTPMRKHKHLYLCRACHAPSNGCMWKARCTGKPLRRQRNGFSPMLAAKWWQGRAAEGSICKIFDMLDLKKGERAAIRRRIKARQMAEQQE